MRRYEQAIRYIISYATGYRLRPRALAPAEYFFIPEPLTLAILYIGKTGRPRAKWLVGIGDRRTLEELARRLRVERLTIVGLKECPEGYWKGKIGCHTRLRLGESHELRDTNR